ncbi:MAG: ECF transporter S component [Lachnospiraceae bacterium]|nr:ECF transporter S component [Lachnospiraceae bacterium]
MNNRKITTRAIAVTAMFLAMNIALSSFGVPVPGGHLYLNDIVIVLAAILLPPPLAFIVGGIGAFLGDLLFYPTPMFVSLVVHGVQAVIISLAVHGVGSAGQGADLSAPVDPSGKIRRTAFGVILGAAVAVVGYSLGRAFIYSTPEYAILKLPYQILQQGIGAVLGPVLAYRFGIEKLYRRMISRSV